ncbi:MAG: hypothetical protein JO168_19915 [Solirubrobacterales bacterium]|nr:hypothetical protein [Solirubrobacterales bacterium]
MSHDREVAHLHYSARRHPEFVVLEIGDDIGALIVYADVGMHGVEIEISPSSDDARRSHKEVLERMVEGRPAYAAVFDRLREGNYTLWAGGVARARDVAVLGGEIAALRLGEHAPT